MKAAIQLISVFISSVFCHTYWVDESCRAKANEAFGKGLAGAKDFASSGLRRLRNDTDAYQAAVFQRLFKTSKDENAANAVNRVQDVLQALSDMTLVSDRNSANVRYYCDDDVQSLDGTTRWKLREDPPPDQRPSLFYVKQKDRPRLPRTPSLSGVYQEWVDSENGMYMGRTLGCQDPGMFRALTYRQTTSRFDFVMLVGMPNRATITICDPVLSGRIHSFEDLPRAIDLGKLVWSPGPLRSFATIDSLEVVSAVTFLHEFCHVPPWRLEDLPAPSDESGPAYNWRDAQDISSTADSLRNVQNIVWFAVLAKLADRDFRLASDDHSAYHGVLDFVGDYRRLLSGGS